MPFVFHMVMFSFDCITADTVMQAPSPLWDAFLAAELLHLKIQAPACEQLFHFPNLILALN